MEREDYARIALAYDTLIARAMCRACGVEYVRPKHAKGHSVAKVDRYGGVRKAFKNRRRVRL